MPSNTLTSAARLADDHHRKAQDFHLQGRLDDAERHYRAALKAGSENPDILHALGMICTQTKQHEEAVELLRRAASATPDDPVVHNNLGMALLHLGRHKEALAALERTIALKPDYPVAYFNLGMALKELGRHDEAIEAFEKAIDAKPDYNNALYSLAEEYKFLGYWKKALTIFKRIVDLRPQSAVSHNNYGLMLALMGQNDEAIAAYRKAIELDPKAILAYTNLSNTFLIVGRAEDALNILDRALLVEPKSATARVGRGFALRSLGHLDEARKDFERGVAMDPSYVDAHRYLAETKTMQEGDPQLGAMEKLLDQRERLKPADVASLEFTLAKAYADLNQTEQSFDHLDTANKTWRKLIFYDEEKEFESFREMARVFTPELIAQKEGLGHPSDVPVFIVGMPRSGTTLVEQILASHPDVYGADETSEFGVAAVGSYDPVPLPFDAAELSATELTRIGQTYLDRVCPRAPDAKRITDKRPDNFRYAGLIHLAFPNARIINLQRDPIDNCLSCYELASPAIFKFTYDLGELGRFYRAYEQLTAHWRAVLPPHAFLNVRYEALVENLEEQGRRIVEFCGLEWDPRCLEFYNAKRSVRTASVVQVRRPIYNSSVGRWRPYKDKLGPLFDALGIASCDL